MRRPSLGHKGRYHFSEIAELERDEMLLGVFGGIRTGLVPVAPIDPALAAIIGANTDVVKIGHTYIHKLSSKHSMVLHYDLGLLHHGFKTGRVQKDGNRHLLFLFRDPRQPTRTLKAAIKSSRDGKELLISTYHVCTGKRLARELVRGIVIRDDGTW